MIENEELQYWINQLPELDEEEIQELLEAAGMDLSLEGGSSFTDFINPKEEPEQSVKGDVLSRVFSNLNKRKSIDIDD